MNSSLAGPGKKTLRKMNARERYISTKGFNFWSAVQMWKSRVQQMGTPAFESDLPGYCTAKRILARFERELAAFNQFAAKHWTKGATVVGSLCRQMVSVPA